MADGSRRATVISLALSGALLTALLARLLRGRLSKLLALAEGWPGMMAMLRGRRAQVVALSLLLWLSHLLQIYMFTIALAMRIPCC